MHGERRERELVCNALSLWLLALPRSCILVPPRCRFVPSSSLAYLPYLPVLGSHLRCAALRRVAGGRRALCQGGQRAPARQGRARARPPSKWRKAGSGGVEGRFRPAGALRGAVLRVERTRAEAVSLKLILFFRGATLGTAEDGSLFVPLESFFCLIPFVPSAYSFAFSLRNIAAECPPHQVGFYAARDNTEKKMPMRRLSAVAVLPFEAEAREGGVRVLEILLDFEARVEERAVAAGECVQSGRGQTSQRSQSMHKRSLLLLLLLLLPS